MMHSLDKQQGVASTRRLRLLGRCRLGSIPEWARPDDVSL